MNHDSSSSSSVHATITTRQQHQQQAEERWARIAAMRRQEDDGYRTSNDAYVDDIDYASTCCLSPLEEEDMLWQMPVDKDCRDKMALWAFQTVDYLKFNRETAAISLSLLDRFMMTDAAPAEDRQLFQLAGMTALYTTVKIHEPVAMDPKLVSTLSQGMYTAAEVQAMEAIMLFAVSWRVNPPTAMAFVRECIELLSLLLRGTAGVVALDEATVRAVSDLCVIQTEVAARECAFLGVPASTVAYCSLLNALQSSAALVNDAEQLAHHAAPVLARALRIEQKGNKNDDNEMNKIRALLYEGALAYGTATAAGITAAVTAGRQQTLSHNSSAQYGGGSPHDANNNKGQCSQQQQQEHKASPRSAMTVS